MKKTKNRNLKAIILVFILINLISSIFCNQRIVNKASADSLLMSQLVQAEPPIQPEPTPGTPNNQYNPPSTEPEPEQELPVWLTIDQVNDQYLSDLSVPYQFTDQMLTFKGRTNILDAVIFIQLSDQPDIIYTTWSFDGQWQWTTPYVLNIASYGIYIWAISPRDPTLIADQVINFQIVKYIIPTEPTKPKVPTEPEAPVEPGKPEIPTEPTTPIEPQKPEIIYPEIVPGETFQRAKEFYNLSVKVLNENHTLYPKDKIIVETDLIKLKPKEPQEIEIFYRITNENQEVILDFSRQNTIFYGLNYIEKFNTSFNTPTGKYFIEARLERDGKIFVANDYFIINEKPVRFWKIDIGINEHELAEALIIFILFLILLLAVFSLVMIDDYRKSQNEKHISEKELSKNDYLDY